MLAVLPFENLGSAEEEYFADGITDEITSRLARISALRVISRTSAMKYKNTDKTIPQIGEELGADYILEGTILWDKSGGDDIGVPVNTVLAEPDADLIEVPDPGDTRRWQGFEEIAATAGDRYVLACFSSPLFQRQWFLRGMNEVLLDLALRPDFAHALLDRLAAFSVEIVKGVAARCIVARSN